MTEELPPLLSIYENHAGKWVDVDDARDLTTYTHPERAFYIFGPEDGTLGKSITERCRDRILVPTKHCMNLAACVNVILYDRLAKQ